MDRYFLRDILILFTYCLVFHWGTEHGRSYGCTPVHEVLEVLDVTTHRCYSLPIVEDRVSPDPIVEDRVSPDPNRCQYSHDGYCDEADRGGSSECPSGTDTADCDRWAHLNGN